MNSRRPNPFVQAEQLEQSIQEFEAQPVQPSGGVRLTKEQTRKLAAKTGYIKGSQATAKTPDETAGENIRSMTVRLPESTLNEFSLYAGKEFGHFQGCKTKFFLKLWEDYKERNALP